MTDFVASIFATHHPSWADMQALLSILLMAGERWMVLSRADEEAQPLHEEDRQGTLDPASTTPPVEPRT